MLLEGSACNVTPVLPHEAK